MVIRGWSGSEMVLGKFPVPGRPTIWMIVGQGPVALAVGAGRSYSFLSSFSIPLGVVGWCDGAGLTSSAGTSYLFGL